MSKTILITGTSSGFGKLTTITLANKGYSVIAGMRGINGKNAAAAKELGSIPNVEVVELDVTDEDSVNTAVAYTISKYGAIDVLVNNAGVAGFGLFEATEVETIRSMFDVNVFGVMRAYQAVLPSMRQNRSGLIINISSGLGILSSPYLAPYAATKFAIEGLTEGIRHEVKDYGIETVTVLPGSFPTDITGKQGFGADKPAVIEAYGDAAQKSLENFGGIMFKKMDEYASDPQQVADSILSLIDMQNGTRPYQTVVNPVAGKIEQAFANSKLAVKEVWLEKMGWAGY
jgi:NAD(P)-dependent dehydrogenase (short-subunit alcohol dehydrogenase family)